MTFFSKKLLGGCNLARGIEYQDYCSLIYLFGHVDSDSFLEMSVERENDFAILLDNLKISVQVKKYKIGISKAKELLKDIKVSESIEYVFICTHMSDDLNSLMMKLYRAKDALKSHMSDEEKAVINDDFINELKKYKFEEFYEQFIISKFIVVPEEYLDAYLLGLYTEWSEANQLNLDKINFLNNLLVTTMKMRTHGKCMDKLMFNSIIEKHKKEQQINEILKTFYDNHLSKPSEILEILGENKDVILSKLQVKIEKADELARNGKYKDSIVIYKSLANLYENEKIFINCAALYELDKDYKKAIEYSNKALICNSNNYEAYFILGTSYCKLNIEDRLDKALKFFDKASKIKETAELYHNIGYTYFLKDDRENAYINYSKALQLDDNLASTHCNISDFVSRADAIYHLDRAIELDRDMYEAYSKKGELLRFIGLPNMALKYFKKCLMYDKFNQEALKGMALSLFELGRFDESMIYLSDWIRVCKNDLFKSFERDRESLIICIDWFKTTFLKLKVLDENHILINMPDGVRCIDISEKDGKIFIGVIKYDTKELGFPIVGKIFNSEEKYNETKKQIYKNKKLWKKKINNLVDLDNFIKVNVKKFSENTYIEICSEDYKVIGYTDNNGEGTESFFKGFKEFECMSIIFKCEETGDSFGIDNVRNLIIEETDDLKLENFIEDISKEDFIKQMNL